MESIKEEVVDLESNGTQSQDSVVPGKKERKLPDHRTTGIKVENSSNKGSSRAAEGTSTANSVQASGIKMCLDEIKNENVGNGGQTGLSEDEDSTDSTQLDFDPLEDGEEATDVQMTEEQILMMNPKTVLKELEILIDAHNLRTSNGLDLELLIGAPSNDVENSDDEQTKGKKRRKKKPGKPEKSYLNCPVCDKEIVGLTDFKRHVKSHSVETSEIQCDLCRANYPTWEDVFIHRRDHRVGKTLLCYICGKTLCDFTTLQTHHKVVHKLKYPQSYHDASRPVSYYPCGICADKFGDIEEIREHLTEHKYRNESNKCEFCFIIFVDEDLLEQHMTKFHFEKTFYCDICRKSFYLSEVYARHMRMKHDGEEIKSCNFSCPHCQLQFTDQKEFEEHVRTHSDSGDVQCDLCRVNYPTWEDVFSHRRIHQVGAEVYCYICGKTLADIKSLRIHHKAVHKLKYPHTYHDTITAVEFYACGVCESAFQNLQDLNIHIDEHKAEKSPFKCGSCLQCFEDSKLLDFHQQMFHLEKDFKCNLCSKAFYMRENYDKHMKIHSDLKPFECNICYARFRRNTALKRHLFQHESGESSKPYICDVCGNAFSCESYLRKHKKSHGSTVHECENCSETFPDSRSLKIHMTLHTGEKVFDCTVCEQRFLTEARLIVHTRIHTGEKPFSCNVCKKTYRSALLLKKHMFYHRDLNGSKKYKCSICGDEFSKYSIYLFHKLAHQGIDGYECEVCERKFPLKTTLKKHMITHSTDRKFVNCVHCNKQFKNASSLKTHFCIDTERKPNFQCEVCGKSFLDRTRLKTHTMTHTDTKYACKECNQVFSSRAAMYSHRQREHGAGSGSSLKCQMCDKMFSSSVSLVQHVRAHAGLKKYQCQVCMEEFEQHSTFQYHKLSHKGIEDFKCEVCGKGFYSNARMKKHLKLHVENIPQSCHICNKVFMHKGVLKNHIAKHTMEKKEIKCDLCGKIFPRQTCVTAHKKSFHQIVPDIKCEVCGKAFFATNTLKKHMSVHTDKALKCDICNKVCEDKGNLRSHMAAHFRTKNPAVKRECHCEMCGKKFSSTRLLSRHIKRIHKKVHMNQ